LLDLHELIEFDVSKNSTLDGIWPLMSHFSVPETPNACFHCPRPGGLRTTTLMESLVTPCASREGKLL